MNEYIYEILIYETILIEGIILGIMYSLFIGRVI